MRSVHKGLFGTGNNVRVIMSVQRGTSGVLRIKNAFLIIPYVGSMKNGMELGVGVCRELFGLKVDVNHVNMGHSLMGLVVLIIIFLSVRILISFGMVRNVHVWKDTLSWRIFVLVVHL